jgi:uncharacterized LabA/DUF88 family protein
VLASGDGDFAILLERIKQRFKTRSEVYGVYSLTADSLITASGKFIPIGKELLLPGQ